jgi:uncharacterized protein (TIGR02217 family)
MAFFEVEFPRSISYKAVGGPSWNTFLVDVASGAEQRNRNWAQTRGRWTVSLITPAFLAESRQAFAEALETFFLMIGGKADGFRFYNHLSFYAGNQAVVAATGGGIQLQRTYTLAGRTYIRTITKPITASVKDYQGNALANTVIIKTSGGTTRDPASYTVDHATGIVTGSVATSDTASCQYHIPVRLDTDDFQMQIEDSDVSGGDPIVSWNSLTLVEVRPPNY